MSKKHTSKQTSQYGGSENVKLICDDKYNNVDELKKALETGDNFVFNILDEVQILNKLGNDCKKIITLYNQHSQKGYIAGDILRDGIKNMDRITTSADTNDNANNSIIVDTYDDTKITVYIGIKDGKEILTMCFDNADCLHYKYTEKMYKNTTYKLYVYMGVGKKDYVIAEFANGNLKSIGLLDKGVLDFVVPHRLLVDTFKDIPRIDENNVIFKPKNKYAEGFHEVELEPPDTACVFKLYNVDYNLIFTRIEDNYENSMRTEKYQATHNENNQIYNYEIKTMDNGTKSVIHDNLTGGGVHMSKLKRALKPKYSSKPKTQSKSKRTSKPKRVSKSKSRTKSKRVSKTKVPNKTK